ncbi:MAG: conserved phage C-terminal domain-containing protein [Candidatus Latescibacter sp.]|nr:conserved phage C-terminal domain-containing protein [Candidatus Latescibacter sp.]
MKWFKHLTDWRNDKDIREAEKELALPGYRFYISLKEIYGRNFNEIDESGYLKFNLKILKEEIKISNKKMLKLLKFFKEKERIDYRIINEDIMIQIPEFIRLANNWEIRRKKGFVDKITKILQNEGKKKKIEEEKKDTKEKEFETAQEILNYLNQKTGKNLKDIAVILMQLRKGKKKEEFIKIIDTKFDDQFFQRNPRLYNQATLFGGDHFERYLNENNKKRENKNEKETCDTNLHDTHEFIGQIYMAYIKTTLLDAQSMFNYILHDYNIYDIFENENLNHVMNEINIVEIKKRKIKYFLGKEATEEHKRLLKIFKEKTGYKTIEQKEVPEDFIKSGFYRYNRELLLRTGVKEWFEWKK